MAGCDVCGYLNNIKTYPAQAGFFSGKRRESKMEILRFYDIKKANQEGIKTTVNQALDRLAFAQKAYPKIILKVVETGNLARQIDLSYVETQINPRASTANLLSRSAGAYFVNEDVISGSREKDVLAYINTFAEAIGIQPRTQKLKLGPGIGFIEAPSLYRRLKTAGLQNPNLTLNYTALFGTSETRKGIKAIVDSKIDPEGNFFPDDGVFLTRGATEAIDLFMEGIVTLKPNSRIVFLGLSYYTGPFSAMQKGLAIDRLMANPVEISNETKFFPTPEEISQSLPIDTTALVLTIPNNPNGETYSNTELSKIIKLAKNRNILILFDAIFENMYFDEKENYRSRVLQNAYELGALDNVVIVDSLSKTMNFPGERVGYLATTNRRMINTLTNIVLARICNPQLTLEPILQFEGLARKIKAMHIASPNTRLDVIVDKATDNTGYSDKNSLLAMYKQWDRWNTEVLKFYKGNLQITKAMLNGSVDGNSPDNAAFNTIVRLSGLPKGTNNVDYLAKLMFTLATYTQVGPCFGLSQKIWDGDLGVWSRITYACSRKDLVEGLIRLITFTRFYAERNFGDPNKFPVLQISYDKQI